MTKEKTIVTPGETTVQDLREAYVAKVILQGTSEEIVQSIAGMLFDLHQEKVGLEGRLNEALAKQVNLRLAKQDDLRGKTPVVFVTEKKGAMFVRLVLDGIGTRPSVIPAKIFRRKDGGFRAQVFVDREASGRATGYKRGVTQNKFATLTRDEWKGIRDEYTVTGGLADEVLNALKPENLRPALEAAGYTEEARFFDKIEVPSPAPTTPEPAREEEPPVPENLEN